MEKTPPAAIQRGTSMDVVAGFTPGSFKLLLERPPRENERQERIVVEDENLARKSIDTLLQLFEAAEEGELTEDIEDIAQSLGSKPSQQIQRLVGRLADSNLSASFRWITAEPRRVDLSTRGAKDLRDWLASVEELTTEIEVLGTLLAGDAESGRFKLQDDAENLYEGKGSPELLDGTQLNRLYRARLSVLEATADHIGAVAQ